MMWLRTILLIFPILLAACASKTTVRHTPNYEATLKRKKNVLILPPVAQVYQVGAFGSKKRVYNYEAEFEALAAEEAEVDLTERGFNVKVMARKNLDEAGAYEAFTHLRNAYESALKELYAQHLWPENKAFNLSKNLGGAAHELSKKTDSDLIAMVDYEGFVKTNGARTLDFISAAVLGVGAGAAAAESSVILIGLVDAKTGNILWTNRVDLQKDLFSAAFSNLSSQKSADAKKLQKLIDMTFIPLEKGS